MNYFNGLNYIHNAKKTKNILLKLLKKSHNRSIWGFEKHRVVVEISIRKNFRPGDYILTRLREELDIGRNGREVGVWVPKWQVVSGGGE